MKAIIGILLIDSAELEANDLNDSVVMSPQSIAEHLVQLDADDLEDLVTELARLVRERKAKESE